MIVLMKYYWSNVVLLFLHHVPIYLNSYDYFYLFNLLIYWNYKLLFRVTVLWLILVFLFSNHSQIVSLSYLYWTYTDSADGVKKSEVAINELELEKNCLFIHKCNHSLCSDCFVTISSYRICMSLQYLLNVQIIKTKQKKKENITLPNCQLFIT